jgi:hypothetical protein
MEYPTLQELEEIAEWYNIKTGCDPKKAPNRLLNIWRYTKEHAISLIQLGMIENCTGDWIKGPKNKCLIGKTSNDMGHHYYWIFIRKNKLLYKCTNHKCLTYSEQLICPECGCKSNIISNTLE